MDVGSEGIGHTDDKARLFQSVQQTNKYNRIHGKDVGKGALIDAPISCPSTTRERSTTIRETSRNVRPKLRIFAQFGETCGLHGNEENPCGGAITPGIASPKQLAGAIKARWVCEQAHQQLKEELGLDHFEGRSWTGLHRHALMTMIAYAFLQSRRLKQAAGGKKNPRPAATAKPSSRPAGDPKRVLTAATNPMPTLP